MKEEEVVVAAVEVAVVGVDCLWDDGATIKDPFSRGRWVTDAADKLSVPTQESVVLACSPDDL